MDTKRERVAVIAGLRTPFVKAGTVFKDYSFQEMGAYVLKRLIEKEKLDPKTLEEFIFGAVILDPRTPNWAREIVFASGLPHTIGAHSVSNNCVSGLLAITTMAQRIALGQVSCGIAGGAESMSNPPLLFNRRATKKFLSLSRAASFGDKAKCILSLRPKDFAPSSPGVTEPSTGLTMGEHMEITAKELKISRESQDKLAFQSHQNAAKAVESGKVSPMITEFAGVDKDLLIRKDSTLEKLSKLRPVFDRSEKGTLTAGNSSPLTDGASVVLLMSESRARSEGRTPLAYISDYEYAAISPSQGLLMAPAVTVPRLLKRNGLLLKDFDLFEVHEAFAAQVEANIYAWENGLMAEKIGSLDRAKLNVHGGSIAIGHPFAATGGRLLTALASELHSRSLKRGLISICAAGAMGGAMIVERN